MKKFGELLYVLAFIGVVIAGYGAEVAFLVI